MRHANLLLLAMTILLAAVILGWLAFVGFRIDERTAEIERASIRSDQGYAFTAPAPSTTFPLYVESDSNNSPHASRMRLFDNGVELVPAHSLHQDVREKGEGRFSHWRGTIYFSASDNTDPRRNNQTYRVSYFVGMHPAVVSGLAVILTAIIGLIGLRSHVRIVFSWLRIWAWMIGAAVFLRVILFPLIGLTEPYAGWGSAKDLSLVAAITLHLGVGIFLFLLTVISGAGLYLLLPKVPKETARDIFLFSYPIGLLVLSGLAVMTVMLDAIGYVIAAVILGASCLPLLRRVSQLPDLASLGRAALPALVFGSLVSATLGLLWHGPTDTLSATPFQDISYSVSAAYSLNDQVLPLRLLTAEGQTMPLNHHIHSFVAASLLSLPGFDPFLFFTVSQPLFLVLWITIAAALWDWKGIRGTGDLFIIAIAIFATARTPSWIAGVPEVPYAFPLIASVYWMYLSISDARMRALIVLPVAVFGSILTKIILIIPLAVLAGWKYLLQVLRLQIGRHEVFFILIGGIVGLTVFAYVLNQWGVVYWKLFKPGPSSLSVDLAALDRLGLAILLRDFGLLLAGVYGLAHRDRSFGLGLFLSAVAFLIYPFLFSSYAGFIPFLLLLDHGSDPRAPRWILPLICSLTIPYIILREWSNPTYGVTMQLFLASAFMLGICSGVNQVTQALRPAIMRLSAAGAIYLFTGLVAVGQGRLLVGSSPAITGGFVTPDHRSIWQAVKRLTPPDALIFTDQTGLKRTVAEGWNAYAGTAARQVYIAGWDHSFFFRTNEAALKIRLAENSAILAGEKTPQDLPLSKNYSSYFAVVSKRQSVPGNFSKMFANGQFVLYQIN